MLTDKAVLRIIEEVEEAHGHQFSPADVKTIIEQYPHARFKNGNLYLRKCSYCQANAVAAKGSGSGCHFMQGDIAFIRHMRRHDLQSGLSGKSIDDHCILGEPVSWDDVLLMSQGREPNKLILINFGKGDAVYGGSTGFRADTKRRASALAVACDTNDAEVQEEEEQPKKRQRNPIRSSPRRVLCRSMLWTSTKMSFRCHSGGLDFRRGRMVWCSCSGGEDICEQVVQRRILHSSLSFCVKWMGYAGVFHLQVPRSSQYRWIEKKSEDLSSWRCVDSAHLVVCRFPKGMVKKLLAIHFSLLANRVEQVRNEVGKVE